MKDWKNFYKYFAVVAFSLGLWLLLSRLGVLVGVEQEALRWRYLLRGEKASSAEIVHVDLDAPSIAYIGDKPWDRQNFGQALLAIMGPGEAKAVGVDIIFSAIGAGSLLDVEKARKGDQFMGQVVEQFQDRIVLAAAYTGTTSDGRLPLARVGYVDPESVPFPESPTFPLIKYDWGRLGLANVDEWLNRGTIPTVVVSHVEASGEGYSRNLLVGAERYFQGLLDGLTERDLEDQLQLVDGDGFPVLSVPRERSQLFFSLGLEMFLAANGLDSGAVEVFPDRLVVRKDGAIFREIPLVDDPISEVSQSFRVNWFEGWKQGRTEHVSLSELIIRANRLSIAASEGDSAGVASELAWFGRFKDKVVFLGPVDATLKDLAPTPFDRVPVPKVSLHANVYRTLEDAAYMQALPRWSVDLITGALTVLVACWVSMISGRHYVSRFGALILLALYAVGAFFVFNYFNVIVPLVVPIGAAMTAGFGVVMLKLGSTELQRRRIKSLFGAYVSPELVEDMVEARRDPQLGGTHSRITALFSDVEGFSAISETLPPEELVGLMNEYLGAMTEALYAQGGTLDKYIGDAIVTMFGMPLPIPDHAAKACLAAIRMQERHAELRKEWEASGRWCDLVLNMRTRIGLNSGDAVIGNMGSKVRFNYTMMGDSVNLAARCESGAKSYGVYTMVTANTLDAALETLPDLLFRALDRIVVKGRSEPVEVYELWDSTVDEVEFRQCKALYEAGLTHYYAGDWQAAFDCFEQSESCEPARLISEITPSLILKARCDDFIQNGGPDNWQGAFKMLSK